MKGSESCLSCRFCVKGSGWSGSTHYSCRRFPPQALSDNRSANPVVGWSMWCGEFVKKEEE